MSSCCIKCFEDVSVRVFITNEAYLGCCDYCDSKQIPVLETWRVGKFIRDGLERAYQCFDHPDNYHDDYFIPAEDTALNLLCDMELFSNTTLSDSNKIKLAKDLLKDSGPSHEDIKDGDEDWLENGDAKLVLRTDFPEQERNKFRASWETFKANLKYHSRFFDFSGVQSRDKLLQPIAKFFPRLEESLNVGNVLCRARSVDKKCSIQTWDLELEMGPPPANKANHSRMNPAGISYLYLSTDIETCISEIMPSVGQKVWLARFVLKQDLKILDCTKIPRVPMPSIFDPEYDPHLRWLRDFFQSFTLEISKPISENDKEIEYLATQVFAEFIRSKGYQGIKYASSQHEGGVNYTLFCDSKHQIFDDYYHNHRRIFTDWLEIDPSSVDTLEITTVNFGAKCIKPTFLN
jgi:hypothetical protein